MAFSEDAIRELAATEEELKKLMASMKRVLSTLSAAKTKVAEKAWPLRDVRKLLVDLKNLATPTTEASLDLLVSNLKQKLHIAENEFERAFLGEIAREAQKVDIAYGVSSGVRYLGPFELMVDFSKETGVLSYAKQPICGPFPLDPKGVVEHASNLATELMKSPLDPIALAPEFEQALRVVLVRDRKPIDGRETRGTLPELFREMQYIRQDRGRPLSSETCRQYSLARFVVELKTLVQSEFNLSSARRFRLETAVIENTKNSKKSVFVPSNLKVGYGEGMYFQALVLVVEGQ